MRIGQGYDIHRLITGRRLMLGGVEIPCEKGEEAHSDGDVLIHAIIDSILGALSKGDIGSHFPPSDEKYKNADSRMLLYQVMNETGARIINLDTTIIIERPKLREHVDKIVESLSRILDIEPSRISVKAKTKEKCDATGSGEAVEAYAIVLLDNN